MTTARPAGKVVRAIRALAWPLRGSCDVLITIDPDTSLSAWLRPVRWVADVHEDYRQLLRDRAWVPRPLLGLLRGAVSVLNGLIARADLVLVADEHVPPMTKQRFVMRNVPDVNVLPPMPPVAPVGELRAVYVGDNRTSRGLRTMVDAVAATSVDDRPWHLDLVGPVAAADREWFERRMAEPDTRLITFHDRMPPVEAWRIAANATVGLCLLADTPAFRDAMPSKVYEYLAMGLPTVATPLPRVVELLGGEDAGVIVDDYDAVSALVALRRLAVDDEELARITVAARVAGERLRCQPSPYDEAAALIAGARSAEQQV